MIPWFKPQYWGNERAYVLDALDSTWISDGEYVKKFEHAFKQTIAVNNIITVSNGTTALYLALLALNIGPGDEVIIPGYTFAAPANMTIAVGATPVFVDIDKETWLLKPELIEAAITPKTKAILPVHIYGNVCEMNKIIAIANKYNLLIIEDVAEAAFSTQKERYTGSFGHAGCFSFQATKTLTMGEGGAVTFSDQNREQRARAIRNHGMTSERPYWHFEIGHNFRLTNMQAAFGYAQLEKLSEIIKQKKRVYQRYLRNLENLSGVKLQKITKDTDAVIWALAIVLEAEQFPYLKEKVRLYFKESGIETRPGFYSFEQMDLYPTASLPVSNYLTQHLISLPSYPSLKDDEIDYICHSLKKMRASNYV